MSQSLVLHRSFNSQALEREKRYCIYLPPSYRSRPDLHYSTLYLLPGLMDYERTWVDKGRVHEHMDALIEEGRIGEMIVVMPDKDQAALEEEQASAFAAYLGQDVIGHIDAEFRTIAARRHRGIEGLSLGASWAIRMALHAPELFSSVGCLSGGFGDEVYALAQHRQDYLRRAVTRFRVGVGSQETEIIADNQRFVRFLRSLGFYCEYDQEDGAHDWPLWQKQIHNSLQFHYYSFNPR